MAEDKQKQLSKVRLITPRSRAKIARRLTAQWAPLIGPVLVVALIGVSSFLIGRNLQSTAAPASATVSADNQAAAPNHSPTDTAQSAASSPSVAPSPTTAPTPAAAAVPAGLVNINNADLTALETLKGIGPSKAQAIIDYRTQNGLFKTVDDLVNVKGIGPKTLDDIRSQITV